MSLNCSTEVFGKYLEDTEYNIKGTKRKIIVAGNGSQEKKKKENLYSQSE